MLPVSQRLQRLRQYSSNFDSGAFDHEDLAAHQDYVLRMRDLKWNVGVPAESSFSDLYSQGGRTNLSLSVYTPGTAQAGIQSSRCIIPLGAAGGSGLLITKWALDGAQDLLVIAEIANIVVPEQLQRRCVSFRAHAMVQLTYCQTGRSPFSFLFVERLEDHWADASPGCETAFGECPCSCD